MERLARLLFVLGVAVLAFGGGFLARSLKIWPYAPFKEAGDALYALAQFYTDVDYLEEPTTRAVGGVTKLDRARAQPGQTFLSLYTGDGFVGRLIDLDGRTLHEWRVGFSEVWGEAPPHVRAAARDSQIHWHGVHLFPNGDLLLNFEGHLFPYGGGLVRLDKDGKVLWKLARNTHHDIAVAEDGTIWAAALNYRPDGMAELPRWEPWFYEDTVLKISPDGRVLDEISVPLALRSLPGILSEATASDDPTHLNNIEPVSPALAAAFPMLEPGDLVLSLRNINSLVAIDPETKRATWALRGPFRQQHDPDLLPNGRILVFDNLGGDPACGRSRVLEIDPVTGGIPWQYDGCGGERFGSDIKGALQLLPNGNLLVTESQGGRAFEVTRSGKPEIVWEYVNLLGERDGQRVVGVIGQAQRFAPGELTFLATQTSALGR